MDYNKKIIGFIVLGFACIIWIITPLVGFLNLSANQLSIYLPSLVVAGEVFFLMAITLLGKEYSVKIKEFIKSKWQNFKSSFKT